MEIGTAIANLFHLGKTLENSEMTEDLILDEAADKMPPKTVVLQPIGVLTDGSFQVQFQHAIEQADAIVIDLLWVTQTDPTGIELLLNGLNQMRALGKSLSFLSMDHKTRTQLDAAWQNQRAKEMSEQVDGFAPEFEQFLERYRSTDN
jgi:anti-anti-sigma regulatory factor